MQGCAHGCHGLTAAVDSPFRKLLSPFAGAKEPFFRSSERRPIGRCTNLVLKRVVVITWAQRELPESNRLVFRPPSPCGTAAPGRSRHSGAETHRTENCRDAPGSRPGR